MALSRKLNKAPTVKTDEEQLAALIMKGGSSGTNEEKETKESIKRVQMRIPIEMLAQIDALTKKRPGFYSRHNWIIEAIENQLKAESSRKGD